MAINFSSPKDSMINPGHTGGIDGGGGPSRPGIGGGIGIGGGDGVDRPTHLPSRQDTVTVPAQPADTVEAEPVRPPFVEVRDHVSDTRLWTAEQWIEAIKQNPEKYLKLFAEAMATGQLSEKAKEGKEGIMMIAQLEMQAHTEAVKFRSNLASAFHESNMGIVQNIRA